MVPTYPEARNELVSAANSVDYAYRETGEGPVPLVLLQHFRAAEADRVALPIWRGGSAQPGAVRPRHARTRPRMPLRGLRAAAHL